MADRNERTSRAFVKISCGNCGGSWKMAGSYSVYGLQAIESNPCPNCGAYTLCYIAAESGIPERFELSRRRRLFGESLSRGIG